MKKTLRNRLENKTVSRKTRYIRLASLSQMLNHMEIGEYCYLPDEPKQVFTVAGRQCKDKKFKTRLVKILSTQFEFLDTMTYVERIA